jgi:hypothetical protein
MVLVKRKDIVMNAEAIAWAPEYGADWWTASDVAKPGPDPSEQPAEGA